MTRSTLTSLGIVLLVVAAGAYWLGRSHGGEVPGAATSRVASDVLFYRNAMNPSITSPVPAKDETGMDYVPVYADGEQPEREVLFYRNPMNPSVTSPVPAKDEMGMDYVPVYAGDSTTQAVPGTVSIDPTVVQNIGVRTTAVEWRKMARQIRTVGRVDYDEDGLARLHLRTEGWIERLAVSETGRHVREGQALLSLYSPQLVSSQQEYVLAMRGVAALPPEAPEEFVEQARALLSSSANRLRLLGVPESELQRLQGGGTVRRETTLTAPVSGIVQFIGVREGQFVSAQTEAYRVADLSSVWVLADLYEDEVPWVRPGDRAEIAIRGVTGSKLEARVDFVYPYLEGRTRTQKVRFLLSNADLSLKPDMYADVTIFAGREVEAITVPDAAVVRSGKRDQVFVVRGAGRFEPRVVKLGVSADGYVEIIDGLDAGEEVIFSGNFMIDSESKLREAVAKLLPPSADSAVDPVPSTAGTMPVNGAKAHEAAHGQGATGSDSRQPGVGHDATPMNATPAQADQPHRH